MSGQDDVSHFGIDGNTSKSDNNNNNNNDRFDSFIVRENEGGDGYSNRGRRGGRGGNNRGNNNNRGNRGDGHYPYYHQEGEHNNNNNNNNNNNELNESGANDYGYGQQRRGRGGRYSNNRGGGYNSNNNNNNNNQYKEEGGEGNDNSNNNNSRGRGRGRGRGANNNNNNNNNNYNNNNYNNNNSYGHDENDQHYKSDRGGRGGRRGGDQGHGYNRSARGRGSDFYNNNNNNNIDADYSRKPCPAYEASGHQGEPATVIEDINNNNAKDMKEISPNKHQRSNEDHKATDECVANDGEDINNNNNNNNNNNTPKGRNNSNEGIDHTNTTITSKRGGRGRGNNNNYNNNYNGDNNNNNINNDQSSRGGRGRGTFAQTDPTLSKPGRTQRAPRLRHNNFDEAEVESLFKSHHNQSGISFDNYNSIEVQIFPEDIPPVRSFEELKVDPHLAANIARCGYKNPTPVQKYAISIALGGGDIMACAQTGSGKTAAFVIPVIQHLLEYGVSPAIDHVSCPVGLILAPTRELALQIFDDVRKMSFKTDIFADVSYGGKSYPHNFENDVLVACPGRLKDLFDREKVSFQCVKFLILDEADRMLEMGFEEQIRYLCGSQFSDMPPPEERQTLMFSATFPESIRQLGQRYLRPRHYLLTVGRVGSTTTNITQRVRKVEKSEKREALLDIICEQLQEDLVLVFVETKREADDLWYFLEDEGIPCNAIHGDREQWEREEALKKFKNGTCPILIATDVASRGLDIPNVTHVIQYDLPKSMDDYTHRIGRTGRAGNKGVATSFFSNNNGNIAAELMSYLSEHKQEVPSWMEDIADEEQARRHVRSSRGGRRTNNNNNNYNNNNNNRRGDDVLDSWEEHCGRVGNSSNKGNNNNNNNSGVRGNNNNNRGGYNDGGF